VTTGDPADLAARFRGLVPSSWFDQSAPVNNIVVSGAAAPLSWSYAFYLYVLKQSRIATATGGWLDIIAWDFFGPHFRRLPGEVDASFSARIRKEILRPRNTRSAILQMLLDLTGNTATVQEPWNPQDWGGYGVATMCGYGIAVGYGSLQYRNQVFVQAVRPNNSGIPYVAGYGTVAAGYGSGNGLGEYADLSQIVGVVTDAEIYSRTSQIISAGNTAWVSIVSKGAIETGRMVLIGPQSAAMAIMQSWF
jgi:hypothetical protein